MVLLNPLANLMRNRLADHLGAPRAGIHVAMPASLIALSPDIDLERLQTRALQS
jgi:hypothetical protein